jgi:opacity protein-like surface antigen
MRLTALFSALLLLGLATQALAEEPEPAATPAAEEAGPGVVIAEEHADDAAPAARPAPLPPWAATLRAGVFVLRAPGIPGHPSGPDVELSLGRTIYDMVSVEANVGYYGTTLTGTGTSLKVIPLTLSLKLTAAPEHGVEPYAVFGLGVALTRLTGGSLAASSSSSLAFHAGLGIRYRITERFYTGLDGRYVFQDVAGVAGRLDGLRFSLLGGALF